MRIRRCTAFLILLPAESNMPAKAEKLSAGFREQEDGRLG